MMSKEQFLYDEQIQGIRRGDFIRWSSSLKAVANALNDLDKDRLAAELWSLYSEFSVLLGNDDDE